MLTRFRFLNAARAFRLKATVCFAVAGIRIISVVWGSISLTVLLAVEIFHAVTSALVVAESSFIFVLVELGFVVPQFSLEDIYYGLKVKYQT